MTQLPSSAILSTSYLPPIQYITKFLVFGKVLLEAREHFQKQSYRNRCVILAANGPLTLVIPVKKNKGGKTLIKEIKIDYDKEWQRLHWRSIVSAYRNSPYFDFYEDLFYPFYTTKEVFLFDYNLKLLELLLKTLDIDTAPECSELFYTGNDKVDYRQSVNPKKRLEKHDDLFHPAEYPQVFKEKYGFIPNLSIVDLLFNKGPESKDVLMQSIKKGIR
ncbi:MAG: WbqC family protein [Bacteroidales bacterium]|nr:WbqC family protein [Bacteroidales bacterium]